MKYIIELIYNDKYDVINIDMKKQEINNKIICAKEENDQIILFIDNEAFNLNMGINKIFDMEFNLRLYEDYKKEAIEYMKNAKLPEFGETDTIYEFDQLKKMKK